MKPLLYEALRRTFCTNFLPTYIFADNRYKGFKGREKGDLCSVTDLKRYEVIAKWLSNMLRKGGRETKATQGAIELEEGNERQIMKKTTKFFDFICFVLGPFVAVVCLFSFEHGRGGFYFPGVSKIGIAIGIALICIGFLRAYWRKNKEGG